MVEHLYESPQVYLEKIHNILKPKGLIVIRTPNTSSFMRYLLGLKCRIFSPRHIVLYNPESLVSLLEKNNFKPIYKEESWRALAYPPIGYLAEGRISLYLRSMIGEFLRWFFGVIGKGESLLIFGQKR